MAAFMRRTLPQAKFIAFTGTPLTKETKSTLGEFYGGKYLDVYTIKQSVEDGATLPILYESLLPELHIEKDLIDQQLEIDFEDASEEKLELIRKKASSLDTIMNSVPRIREIANHIVNHYLTTVRPNNMKAMVVCHSKEAAANYQHEIETIVVHNRLNLHTKLIVSQDEKRDSDLIKRYILEDKENINAYKSFIHDFPPDENESSSGSRKKGVEKTDDTAILIVCDMLLTGYDAPIVQYMYLDKILKEHNLLQAIARVNRTRPNKTAGHIIDYCGITEHLSKALAMYSEDLNPHDVMETPKEELTRLLQRHNALLDFFKANPYNRKTQPNLFITDAVKYLEPEDLRDRFKVLLRNFNVSIDRLLPSPDALEFKDDLELFNHIKLRAANMYVDEKLRLTPSESLKIRELVNTHLHSFGIEYLLDEPISIIDHERFTDEINKNTSPETMLDTKINRTSAHIRSRMDKNPAFYKPLWQRIQELIDAIRNNRLSTAEGHTEIDKIIAAISNKEAEIRALGFSGEGQFAVYVLLCERLRDQAKEETQELTHGVFKAISGLLGISEWIRKEEIKKSIRQKIKELLRGKIPVAERDAIAYEIIQILEKNVKG